MAQLKLSIRDICRIAIDPRLTNREVARMAGVSPTTVNKYRSMMKIHGIDRTILDSLSLVELEDKLQAKYKGSAKTFIEPDWDKVYQEYQKRDVTIALLYQEYVALAEKTGGGSLRSASSFGRKLRDFCKSRGLSMRQEHLPGQEMYVDFSGKHLYITNIDSKPTPVEIFVACLGHSRMIFVTAVPSQRGEDWIEANVRALEYFGGAPAMIVPDNLKSAVITPKGKGREIKINRSYLDFAQHYKTVIVPARPRKPQDKSLVEGSVKIINRWIIAALRNHVFTSFFDMNETIYKMVDELNMRYSKILGSNRRRLFNESEAGCLQPLPSTRHEYTQWKDGMRVPKDYHVQYNRDFYSVPHHLAGRTVNLCITRSTIKIYTEHSSSPVAVHLLGSGEGRNISNREHMPDAHKAYASNNIDDLMLWSESVGLSVKTLFNAIVSNKRIPQITAIQQMSKAQKLAKEYSNERLESACRYANSVGTQTIPNVENILKLGVDIKKSTNNSTIATRIIQHNNVRGAAAYKGVA